MWLATGERALKICTHLCKAVQRQEWLISADQLVGRSQSTFWAPLLVSIGGWSPPVQLEHKQCALWQGWVSSPRLQGMQRGGGRWRWGWRGRWGRRGELSGWPPSRALAGPGEADVTAFKAARCCIGENSHHQRLHAAIKMKKTKLNWYLQLRNLM